jgi:hypothetical protein
MPGVGADATGTAVGRGAHSDSDYREVVSPDDADRFIHLIGDDVQDRARAVMGRLSASLPELGLSVSTTGRVVDFLAKEFVHR